MGRLFIYKFVQFFSCNRAPWGYSVPDVICSWFGFLPFLFSPSFPSPLLVVVVVVFVVVVVVVVVNGS